MTNKTTEYDGWFHSIFVSPFGIPLMIPFILLFFSKWLGITLLLVWVIYTIYYIDKNWNVYYKEKTK